MRRTVSPGPAAPAGLIDLDPPGPPRSAEVVDTRPARH